jgi:hypothetical protein
LVLAAKGSPSRKKPKKLPIKENNKPSRVCTKLRRKGGPKSHYRARNKWYVRVGFMPLW